MFAARLLSSALRAPAPSPLLRLAAAGPSSAARFVASPSLLRRPYSAAAPADDAKALKDQLKTALKTAMKARDTAQTGIVKVRLSCCDLTALSRSSSEADGCSPLASYAELDGRHHLLREGTVAAYRGLGRADR
jgi:hypothetical protein